MNKCARCQMPLFPSESTSLPNTTISVCHGCFLAWSVAPEANRLRAISASLFAEYIERERCERLNATQPSAAPEVSNAE